MAKIYRVIRIKLNQFERVSIWSVTYQQSVFKRYLSNEHLSEFLPTRWRQKSTGIDMEQNYVTVTLCIARTDYIVNQTSSPNAALNMTLNRRSHIYVVLYYPPPLGGSVAEWLACWTQAQKGPGSNRSRDAVG